MTGTLLGDLRCVLEEYGTEATLIALADASDALADVRGNPEMARARRAAAALRTAVRLLDLAEDGHYTLASACEVLDDLDAGDEAAVGRIASEFLTEILT